jgi:hypothetical protein
LLGDDWSAVGGESGGAAPGQSRNCKPRSGHRTTGRLDALGLSLGYWGGGLGVGFELCAELVHEASGSGVVKVQKVVVVGEKVVEPGEVFSGEGLYGGFLVRKEPKSTCPAATERDDEVQLLAALISRGGLGDRILVARFSSVNIREVKVYRRLPSVNLRGRLRHRLGLRRTAG